MTTQANFHLTAQKLQANFGVRFHQTPKAFMALDAQPTLQTVANHGIPAYLQNFLDPAVVDVIVSPMKATEIAPESQKGDVTTLSAQFKVIESTGETAPYGDFSEAGASNFNANYPVRESYLYQTVTQWGDLEADMDALAKITTANQKNIASILVLNKFQNKSYFYGVSGVKCYGILNDPGLPAATTAPAAWSTLTGEALYEAIRVFLKSLIKSSQGIVEPTSKITMAMSPGVYADMLKTNQFNFDLLAKLKAAFPGLNIVTAPEYATAAGELVQLFADGGDGTPTIITAFNTKLRTFPLIQGVSSWKQKKAQGTFGAIVFRPMLCAQMIVS